jgi:tRNA threonylcarbamoyladenosine biosynthesis protein TsaE
VVYHTETSDETVALGRALASQLKPGDVVAFYGDLGAGKTTMIKGVAAGLRVADVVKSPSFVIMTEYAGRLPVYHIDLYRLNENTDFGAIGLDSYIEGEGVCLIEWAERAEEMLPEKAVRVRMSVEGEGRKIAVGGLSAPLQPLE